MITHQIHATLHISHHFDEYQHVDGRLHKTILKKRRILYKSELSYKLPSVAKIFLSLFLAISVYRMELFKLDRSSRPHEK